MAAHCQGAGGIGWIFGHLINGLQAEYARVPFAETSVHLVPEGVSDEQVLFLADILPTAFEVGVLNGAVSPGDVVAAAACRAFRCDTHHCRRPGRGAADPRSD